MENPNPLTRLDYPDPDVIRVGDTYYMVSTTMHFFPGGEILRSYDLVHWEWAAWVYDTLEDNPAHRLEGDSNIYGKGMWAASLRHHGGQFFVCFVANDTGKTYLFRSVSIEGPWKRSVIEGFYHDCSLLFDDTRVFIAYGNTEIRLTELEADLSKPKAGGLDRVLVAEKGNPFLGYEGSHLYKIRGRYHLFLIHSSPKQWRRIEACFSADSLEGEFRGGDILDDDRDYCGQGVAQGGIVDTPEGLWYAVLFQDHGAVGRIPVLVPLGWDEDRPVLGAAGKVPAAFPVPSSRPDHRYTPLVGSDDFTSAGVPPYGLNPWWQWNHVPGTLWAVDRTEGTLTLRSEKVCADLTQAANTLTQRMSFPRCEATVTLDGSALNDGDFAGLCALQGRFGLVALTRDGDRYFVAMAARTTGVGPGQEFGRVEVPGPVVTLKLTADFDRMKDEVEFFFQDQAGWTKVGITHKLSFQLDHFTGCRAGLFLFSTKTTGGKARFSRFQLPSPAFQV